MMFSSTYCLPMLNGNNNNGQYVALNTVIENFVREIMCLRNENQFLRRKFRAEKKCYNCNMPGHLARACCRPSKTDCNWRTGTASQDIAPSSANSGPIVSELAPITAEIPSSAKLDTIPDLSAAPAVDMSHVWTPETPEPSPMKSERNASKEDDASKDIKFMINVGGDSDSEDSDTDLDQSIITENKHSVMVSTGFWNAVTGGNREIQEVTIDHVPDVNDEYEPYIEPWITLATRLKIRHT